MLTEEGIVNPSLAKNSFARFLADGSRLGFGLMTTTITARALGPAGKGTLSVLLLIAHAFLVYACTMGLGDAAIILIGKKRADPKSAFSMMVLPLAATCFFGALVLAIAIPIAQWERVVQAVLFAGFGMVCWVYLELTTSLLNSREEVVTTSLIFSAAFAVTACSTALFVLLFDFGIAGGALGSSLGGLAALILSLFALRRRGLLSRPTWDWRFLRKAAKFGVPLQVSLLLIALSQRMDQLLVYSLSGEARGGLYSIALTLGQLVIYLPAALSTASFPRLAHMSDKAALILTQRVARVGTAGSLIGGVILVGMIPLTTPVVFGHEYVPAVGPALLLASGGILWAHLWMLARAAAARGLPSAIFGSFGVGVLIMLVLDVVLIPSHDLMGAAWASCLGTSGGLLTVHLWYRRRYGSAWRFTATLPRLADFGELTSFAVDVFTRRSA